MSIDVENYLDAFGIVAPKMLQQKNFRRNMARIVMTIHMMKADNVIKPSETSFLCNLVKSKFALDDETSKQLAQELCDDSDLAPDLQTLVDYIKSMSTVVERADCVREMWEIAVCDQELHMLEDDFAYRCAELLDVDTSELSWLQELAVESQLGGGSKLDRPAGT